MMYPARGGLDWVRWGGIIWSQGVYTARGVCITYWVRQVILMPVLSHIKHRSWSVTLHRTRRGFPNRTAACSGPESFPLRTPGRLLIVDCYSDRVIHDICEIVFRRVLARRRTRGAIDRPSATTSKLSVDIVAIDKMYLLSRRFTSTTTLAFRRHSTKTCWTKSQHGCRVVYWIIKRAPAVRFLKCRLYIRTLESDIGVYRTKEFRDFFFSLSKF